LNGRTSPQSTGSTYSAPFSANADGGRRPCGRSPPATPTAARAGSGPRGSPPARARRIEVIAGLDRVRAFCGGQLAADHADEASRSAAHLRALASLAVDGWLAEVTSDADIQAIERIRRAAFGGTDDRPL
jgi:hypothetical protein